MNNSGKIERGRENAKGRKGKKERGREGRK